jgi:signal transduction histidine kinase/CheY-like chemotaxis protein
VVDFRRGVSEIGMRMEVLTEQLKKQYNLPWSLRAQVALFVAAATFAPLALLLAVSSTFFTNGPESIIPFEYWAFLTVAWVLGTALIIARVFASGLDEQLRPLRAVAAGLRRGTSLPTVSAEPQESGNELETLAAQFSQLEAALADSRAAVLGRVSELEEENAVLRESVERHAEFLSSVSHEIRTPLSAIVSAARIIQHYHEKKPEVVGRFGDTIMTEGKRLLSLTNNLVDLAKLEAGRFDWDDGDVCPAKIATEAAHRIEAMADEHGVNLRVEVSESLPGVWGDTKRLGEVAEHLLTNAVRFTPRGGRVEISAVEKGDCIRFSVKDTGAGLSGSECERVFDKHHGIATRHSAGVQGGTRLGLPICREIVSRHDGRIWASSQSGTGTAFYFELPIHSGRDAKVVPILAAKERPLRALLVMKNEVLADAATRALRLEDIDSRVCSQFQEAFEIQAEWRPDVVVVSSACVWQLTEAAEARLRKGGVSNILMASPQEGLVEMNPPTHSEPLLLALTTAVDDGRSLLLVEDDEEYASVLEFELSQAGYEVVQAYNGVDALRAIEASKPDAMILDLMLPQLDGFGVLSRLRERGLSIPALVLTALDDPTVEEKLHGLGAVGIFKKSELIQPRSGGAAARVKKILRPILESTPASALGEAGIRARGA